MLEVAIVGAGLCGLTLAHSLQARHVAWSPFEARERLGGRVLTPVTESGMPLDRGPISYWPATQPSIARLVDELGPASLERTDDGRVLLLDDPNRMPRLVTASEAGTPADGTTPRPAHCIAAHGGWPAGRLRSSTRCLRTCGSSNRPGTKWIADWRAT